MLCCRFLLDRILRCFNAVAMAYGGSASIRLKVLWLGCTGERSWLGFVVV